MLKKVAIVGWGMSEQTPAIEDSRINMIYETVRPTMDRYGVKRDDLGTVIMCSNDFYDGHTISNVFTVEVAGAYMKDEGKVEQAVDIRAIQADQCLENLLGDLEIPALCLCDAGLREIFYYRRLSREHKITIVSRMFMIRIIYENLQHCGDYHLPGEIVCVPLLLSRQQLNRDEDPRVNHEITDV